MVFLFPGDNIIEPALSEYPDFKVQFSPRKIQDGIAFFSFKKNENDLSSSHPHQQHLFLSKINEDGTLAEPVELRVYQFNGWGYSSFDYCHKTNQIFFAADNPNRRRDEPNPVLLIGKLNDGSIGKLEVANFCNRRFRYAGPTISEDGKTLMFCSDLNGAMQLYQSKWNSIQDKWDQPELVAELKEYDMISPNLINDSLLVFSAKMEGGKGGFDLYKSEKIDGIWNSPENWEELNSEMNELDLEMMDEKTGYFSSNGDSIDLKVYYFKID